MRTKHKGIECLQGMEQNFSNLKEYVQNHFSQIDLMNFDTSKDYDNFSKEQLINEYQSKTS